MYKDLSVWSICSTLRALVRNFVNSANESLKEKLINGDLKYNACTVTKLLKKPWFTIFKIIPRFAFESIEFRCLALGSKIQERAAFSVKSATIQRVYFNSRNNLRQFYLRKSMKINNYIKVFLSTMMFSEAVAR